MMNPTIQRVDILTLFTVNVLWMMKIYYNIRNILSTGHFKGICSTINIFINGFAERPDAPRSVPAVFAQAELSNSVVSICCIMKAGSKNIACRFAWNWHRWL